jgi:hypothetical protein
MRTIVSTLTALALATTTGCSFSDSSGSFSDSSGSISDSISSPSKSISNSSDGDGSSSDEKETPEPESTEDKASYQKDVSQLTVTYIKSGGDISAFRTGISNLAKARGITDWEADSATTQAIGVGAGKAGLQEVAFDDFSKHLVGDDLTKLNDLRIGYQQTAPSAAQQATNPAAAAPAVGSASTDTASAPGAQ